MNDKTTLPLPNIETFIKAAEEHGCNSDPDHEVGDLQSFLRAAWALMSADQKRLFPGVTAVRETYFGAVGEEPDAPMVLPAGQSAGEPKTAAGESPLSEWTVRYGDQCLQFHCLAEDIAHALEQCQNAYPDEPIVTAYPGKTDAVKVHHWGSERYAGQFPDGEPFEMELTDRRRAEGILWADLVPASGHLDAGLYAQFEVNRLPGESADVPCVHLHFDTDNLAASIFKKGSDRYVLRPETGVTVKEVKLADGTSGYEFA